VRVNILQSFVLGVAFGAVGCTGTDSNSTLPANNVGGATGIGQTGGSGPAGLGGASVVATTGNTSIPSGGAIATGGATAITIGGSPAGGKPATGGTTSVIPPTGGVASGGAPTGGRPATSGTATGGAATGGRSATGGTTTGPATGGSTTGGAATGGGSAVNCSAVMPTGGTAHCGQNTQGNAGSMSWSLWSNKVNSAACITTFSTPAFSSGWGESGDFLARIGLEWGSGGKTYDQYGTISAQFAYTKTGTAGGYSYIGIYGWSINPCVEYYIVEDSYNSFPFNAYNSTQKGTATIDGEVYKLFANSTTGSGGSRCPSGTTSWQQYWSIRQKARQCGTITISQHFDAWKAAGMPLGNMLEAKILVEVGGGTGSLNFPVASVTTTK